MKKKDFELITNLSDALEDAVYYSKLEMNIAAEVEGTSFYIKVVDDDCILYEVKDNEQYVWMKIPMYDKYHMFLVKMMFNCITY